MCIHNECLASTQKLKKSIEVNCYLSNVKMYLIQKAGSVWKEHDTWNVSEIGFVNLSVNDK